jgi:protein-disulfide isomerase
MRSTPPSRFTSRIPATVDRAIAHLGVAVIAMVVLAGCATTSGGVADEKPSTPAPPAAPRGQADFRTLGSPAAPVTVIEFTDLQCPYCARFALETWPELRKRYVDTGKVLFVARDLPLSFHPFALPAAVAARCAGQQGRFWEYREALFRGQSRLATAPYAELARRFGLDVEQFEACRADSAVLGAVREDAATAARNGITSTPTFVVGRVVAGEFMGEVLSGAQPVAAFTERIEALLREQAQP